MADFIERVVLERKFIRAFYSVCPIEEPLPGVTVSAIEEFWRKNNLEKEGCFQDLFEKLVHCAKMIESDVEDSSELEGRSILMEQRHIEALVERFETACQLVKERQL